MAVTTYDHFDKNERARSGTLRKIFNYMTAAREKQMRHRVDAALNSLDAENLARHGYDRRAASGADGAFELGRLDRGAHGTYGRREGYYPSPQPDRIPGAR